MKKPANGTATPRAPRAPRTPTVEDSSKFFEAVVGAVEKVVPTVIEAVMRDRAAERAHEVALLEKDREYAMARLQIAAQAASADSPIEIIQRAVSAVAAQVAARQAGAAGNGHVEPPTP